MQSYIIPSLSAKNYRWWWPTFGLLILLLIAFLVFSALYEVPRAISGLGILLVQGELNEVISNSEGTIDSWLVEEGDALKKGQAIARLRTDHEPFELINILAPQNGLMAEIIAYPQTQVKKGDSLALITAQRDPHHHLELIGFVSSLEGKKISAKMKARVWPSITDPYHDGALLASVKQVGKLPMTKAAVQSIIKIPGLAKYIRNKIEAEPFLVVLSLDKDEHQVSGYRFSKAGPAFELDSGVIANFDIIYDEQSLLQLSWPSLGRLSLALSRAFAPSRHCERKARGNPALWHYSGLLRCARNDDRGGS